MTNNHRLRTCPQCQVQFPDIGANFCQFCGLALTGPPNAIRVRRAAPPVRSGNQRSIMKERPNVIDPTAVRHFELAIYQAKEALYGRSIRWKLGGKDYAAYEAMRETEEVLDELTEVLKQDAVQTAKGFLAGETAVRHAQLQDSIRRSQMMHGAETIGIVLQTVVESLEAKGFPEESIIDIVEGVSKLVLEKAMYSESPRALAPRQTDGDRGPIIIDPDEF